MNSREPSEGGKCLPRLEGSCDHRRCRVERPRCENWLTGNPSWKIATVSSESHRLKCRGTKLPAGRHRLPVIRPAGVLCLLLAAPRLAGADTPIADRNYVIDAYRGAAVADYRVIGMGGVSLATAEGALGLLANPAAAASRPSTASGWFYWDFLLDAYTPGLGVDYDNNGTPQDRFNGTTGALNAGLSGMFGAWGVAVSVTGELRDFTLSGGTQASLSATIWRLTLARSFADGEWIAGANLVGGGFNLRLPGSGVDLVNAGDWSMEPGVAADPRRLVLGASALPRRDRTVAPHPRPRRALLVVLALGQPVQDASLARRGRRAAIREHRLVARVLALTVDAAVNFASGEIAFFTHQISRATETRMPVLQLRRSESSLRAGMPEERARAAPFLKWAGGKTTLLAELLRHVPRRLRRYHEPFVGGGALFFAVAPRRAILSHNNAELVHCYLQVRDDVHGVLDALGRHVYEKAHYQNIRALDPLGLSPSARAARFIYLNKTCFNGLWRVNRAGRFNVPIVRYTNPRFHHNRPTLVASLATKRVVNPPSTVLPAIVTA